MIPDEVADKAGPQRPVGQIERGRGLQAGHPLRIGPQQRFGFGLEGVFLLGI